MTHEPSARRPGFREGLKVRLADGELWSLPILERDADDPEYVGLLRAMAEAEDREEWLLAGLALTIMLLSRNYDLPAEELSDLLSFPSGDPVLLTLQRDVGALGEELDRRIQGAAEPNSESANQALTPPRRSARTLWTQ
jgi:hypothetical protein